MSNAAPKDAFPLSDVLDLDPQLLGIYFVGILGIGWGLRYIWTTYIRPPSVTGFGKGAPGFMTGVRKAWVENPNPGRQIIERDDRHLYQSEVPGGVSSDAPPEHTRFSIKEKLAAEAAAAAASGRSSPSSASGRKTRAEVDDEWLPEGLKERNIGKGKKGRK